MGLKLDDATRIVDSAVKLPKKINCMLGNRAYKLDWLIERDSDRDVSARSIQVRRCIS